jgi:glycosyltransferase involved in cell wall biosynthesis
MRDGSAENSAIIKMPNGSQDSVPLLSICLPTYNYARYLPEAIDSLLNQSFTDFELIIVDDCSQDESRAVIEEYARRDKRIRFEINASNLGLVQNWNKCLGMARGTFIKFLFGDDFLTSNDCLKRMVERLQGDLSVSLVASARKIVDAHSREEELWSHWPDGAVIEGTAVIKNCLLEQRNYIGEPSAVMFRREQARRGFNERYIQLVDLEMWFHLLEQGSFAYIAEPICAFRKHPEQQTRKAVKNRSDVLDTHLLLRDYLSKPYLQLPLLDRWFLGFDHIYQLRKKRKILGIDDGIVSNCVVTYGKGRFYFHLPVFKAYRELRRFYKRSARRLFPFAISDSEKPTSSSLP